MTHHLTIAPATPATPGDSTGSRALGPPNPDTCLFSNVLPRRMLAPDLAA